MDSDRQEETEEYINVLRQAAADVEVSLQRLENPDSIQDVDLPAGIVSRTAALLGYDLSDIPVVRLAGDSPCPAPAFTDGHRIFLAPEAANWNERETTHLVAHELTHVVQQRVGRIPRPRGPNSWLLNDPLLETEADVVGRLVSSGIALPAMAGTLLPLPSLPPSQLVVQCALVRTPTMVTTRLALRGDDPSDFGVTTHPANVVAPQFNVVTSQRRDGWHFYFQINGLGAPGTNSSRYLGVGLYRTGTVMTPAGKMEVADTYILRPGERRIYVKLNAQTANLNRQAEQEHCDDIRRGYRITIGAIQHALDQLKQGGHHGPYPKHDKAMRAARGLAKAAVGQQRLKALFQKHMTDSRVERYGFGNDLKKLCLDTMALSRSRDDGRHTFIPGRPAVFNDLSWSEWWKVDAKTMDVRMLVPGPQFQVPGPTTNNLIHL